MIAELRNSASGSRPLLSSPPSSSLPSTRVFLELRRGCLHPATPPSRTRCVTYGSEARSTCALRCTSTTRRFLGASAEGAAVRGLASEHTGGDKRAADASRWCIYTRIIIIFRSRSRRLDRPDVSDGVRAPTVHCDGSSRGRRGTRESWFEELRLEGIDCTLQTSADLSGEHASLSLEYPNALIRIR